MEKTPDMAGLGGFVDDPATASMLMALLGGKALTATELAGAGGVSVRVARAHLGRLRKVGLLRQRRQGRHCYFALVDGQIAQVLQAIMDSAVQPGHSGHRGVRTGPRAPALRRARACYRHLAGAFGVRMFDSLLARQYLLANGARLELSGPGEKFAAGFGIDIGALERSRPLLCKSCLDWSERRSHLAGALGAAFLNRIHELGWARRQDGSRVIAFTKAGTARFHAQFPLP